MTGAPFLDAVPGGLTEQAGCRFSIVVLTFARDNVLRDTLDRIWSHVSQRGDVELILVDNNPYSSDRERMLDNFPASRYIWTGRNKGVVARNDGIDAACGDFVVLIDDDVLVETPDFLDRFASLFDADRQLGAVTTRKHVRGETRRRTDLIPHTDKMVDLTRPFATFRFVGGCVGMRRSMLREVGGFLPEFFYGGEETELSLRIVSGGWSILYSPEIVSEELEHPAGRKPRRDAQTERLYNKYVMTWLHMPLLPMIINFPLFTAYLAWHQRGEVDVPAALLRFGRWLWRKDRPRRTPLSAAARRYIRECGGAVWR